MRSVRLVHRRRPIAPPERHVRRRPFGGTEDRQRGAALVEGAFVFPIFFLLVFGLFDGAWALFANHVVEGAAASGARAASALSNDPDTDYEALQRIEQDIDSLGRTRLVRIVIYKASAQGEAPTDECKTKATGVSGVCNVYFQADLNRPDTDFRCQTTSPDRFWCPTIRKTAVRGPNSPPDFVGVWVSMTQTPLSGIVIRTTRTVNRHAVVGVEPRTTT